MSLGLGRHDDPPAPQPVWALPASEVLWQETEPLEYHQLLRGVQRPRWWKPLAGLILGGLYYLTLGFGFAVALGGIASVVAGEPLTQETLSALATPDTQRPLSMVMSLGSIALLLPAALLAMASVGLNPVARLWSVALGIRWRWIGRSVLPAIAALAVVNVASVLFAQLFAPSQRQTALDYAGFDANAAWWSALVILLLVPLQSTAEELVFRGALMQAIGAWRRLGWVVGLLVFGLALALVIGLLTGGLAWLLDWGGRVLVVGAVVFGVAAVLRWRSGSPVLVIGLPSAVFALVHIYELWGMLSVASMALVAAWLVWRTGGLEVAITLHVVNNLVGFLLLVTAVGGETKQTATDGTPVSLIASVLGQLLFAWWIDRKFSRSGERRVRVDVVQRWGFVPAAPSAAPVAQGAGS